MTLQAPLKAPFPWYGLDLLSRFWRKVNKETSSGCWLWTASKRNKGYGAFAYTLDDTLYQERAHRFSWMLYCGPIPEGLFVLHRCDTPACVNPEHLFLGTNQDNIKDMLAKGRHVRGGTYCKHSGLYQKVTEHHSAVLTEEAVRQLRADYATGAYSYTELCNKYQLLSIGHAWRIVHRKAWKHVD